MAHQFSCEKQHRNLVTVAHFGRLVGIDIEHVDADRAGFRQGRKLDQHLFTQAAPGARVQ
jgi:hypothetical protein